MRLYFSDLCTLGSTISTSCGDEKVSDVVGTLLTTSTTTATTNGRNPSVVLQAETARDYVSSMSVEEVDDLLTKIDERMAELGVKLVEEPKIKKLGSIDGKKM